MQSQISRTLLTFRAFAEKNPAFPESSLRHLRFNQSQNGFASAFIEIGRRVLIDEERFFFCVDQLQESGLSSHKITIG